MRCPENERHKDRESERERGRDGGISGLLVNHGNQRVSDSRLAVLAMLLPVLPNEIRM